MTSRTGTLTYPPGGFGAPEGPQGERDRLGRAAGGHRGLLGRRPHLAGRGHLLRAVPRLDEGPGAPRGPRGRRVDAGHRREDLPAPRVQRRAAAVRPAGRRGHQRRRGPDPRARIGRHPPRARLPQRAARSHGLARQGRAGPLLPDLQRVHRRAAGALERPLLRRRDPELVGRRRVPPVAGRDEGGSASRPSGCPSSPAPATTASPSTTTARPCTRCGRRSRRAACRWRTTSARRRWRSPCRDNGVLVGMVHNAAPFREMFGRYVFGGILDRHPGLRVGWFEGGINWVPAAIQDAEHLYASAQHMADHEIEHDVGPLLAPPHVRLVHGRSAGARADRPDRRRPGDVVVGLPAQREHLRLLGAVAGQRGRRGRPRRRRQDRQHERDARSSASIADERPAHRRRRAGSTCRRRPIWPGCAATAAPGCDR